MDMEMCQGFEVDRILEAEFSRWNLGKLEGPWASVEQVHIILIYFDAFMFSHIFDILEFASLWFPESIRIPAFLGQTKQLAAADGFPMGSMAAASRWRSEAKQATHGEGEDGLSGAQWAPGHDQQVFFPFGVYNGDYIYI